MNTETLLDAPTIQKHVARLGREIAADHPDGVVVVGVLKGALLFLADLVRAIPDTVVTVDFMSISRFAPDSGRVRILHDVETDITGRDVAEQEYALRFDPDFGMWSKLDGRPADYRLSDLRAQILRYLHEQGTGKPAQIADALGLDRANVRQTIRRMADAGQVDDLGRGLYVAVTPVTQSLTENEEE